MSNTVPTVQNKVAKTSIGLGSFGDVSVIEGGPIAFKVGLFASEDKAKELRGEYDALVAIRRKCNSDSFFSIPKPHAFYDPKTSTFEASPSTPPLEESRRSAVPISATNNPFEPFPKENAAYAMERVHAIPLAFGEHIRKNWYHERHRGTEKLPALCRLYFGKSIIAADGTSRVPLFSSNNFPLDAARYTNIWNTFNKLIPSPEDVAHGMGQMLGRIHWRAGYDGGDIEFVMGGDGFADVTFYVMDFNKMESFPLQANPGTEVISKLSKVFFTNDPYYPRPRPGEPLYESFKRGYMEACGNYTGAAQLFLADVEGEQARRGQPAPAVAPTTAPTGTPTQS